MIVECLICDKKVDVMPSRAKKFKTCSKECMGLMFRGKDNTICEHCGKEFHLKPKRKRRSKYNFCSISCHASWKSENQRGSNNPNFRNRQYDHDGYRIIHTPTYGRIKEHKAVVMDILGVYPKELFIHHRDCNPLNNVPENLVLLTNSDHWWLHKQFGNATLYAYYYNKIDKESLISWSNDKERTERLLDTNILNQKLPL